MPSAKTYQSIMTATLDKYALQGFTLEQYGDDFLVLYHEGEEIRRTHQLSPLNTPAIIQCECEAHLTLRHGV